LSLNSGLGWSCGDVLADSRDSKQYDTVLIGTQCWMAQNLNVGTMIAGAINPTDNSIIEKYCYLDLEANCISDGGLYQWNEAMQYVTTIGAQGICPIDWHIPTDIEMCTLEQVIDPSIPCESAGFRGINGGGKMKEAGTTHWSSETCGGTCNTSGFTLLGAGYRDISGTFSSRFSSANLWSSTQSSNDAWRRYFTYSSVGIMKSVLGKTYGVSVRCLKD